MKRVALVGLDGSGKSANIEKMKKDGDYSGYRFVWVRWKPVLLKPAYWLLGKNISKKSKPPEFDTDNRSGSGEQAELNSQYTAKAGMKEKLFKNPAVRGIWMALAIVDYFLQFHAKTIALRKKDVVFDRFYLDLFVDQGINFGFSPQQIEREIARYQWLFPGMDKIIYIRVSPETCFNRKDDIPNMDYLLKRYDIYEHLSADSLWVSLDGEKPLDEVNAAIKNLILAR